MNFFSCKNLNFECPWGEVHDGLAMQREGLL